MMTSLPSGRGSRLGEAVNHLRGPEVLVLDVDEAAGALDRPAVAPGHAALAGRREGVTAAPRRVGAQQLEVLGPTSVGVGPRRRPSAGPFERIAQEMVRLLLEVADGQDIAAVRLPAMLVERSAT